MLWGCFWENVAKGLDMTKSLNSIYALWHTNLTYGNLSYGNQQSYAKDTGKGWFITALFIIGKSRNNLNGHHSLLSVHARRYFVAFYKIRQKYVNQHTKYVRDILLNEKSNSKIAFYCSYIEEQVTRHKIGHLWVEGMVGDFFVLFA